MYNYHFPVPTGAPVGLMPVFINSTSTMLIWAPPPIHERNGIITSYTITQVTAGNSITYTTTDLMLLVTQLRPFTSYTFDIAASTRVGRGPLHSPMVVTTLEDGMLILIAFVVVKCRDLCNSLNQEL